MNPTELRNILLADGAAMRAAWPLLADAAAHAGARGNAEDAERYGAAAKRIAAAVSLNAYGLALLAPAVPQLRLIK